MALLLKGYHCKFWNTNRLSTSYTTSHRFIISYFSNQVRDFEIKAFIKSWFSHVIVLESLLLRSCLHCGHHACYRTLIFLRNIGNRRQCATSSSQRSLGNLQCYCATIRGSKLPLLQDKCISLPICCLLVWVINQIQTYYYYYYSDL